MNLDYLQHRNARLYIIINIFQNLWFIEAVWYFFFANFVSYFEIGVVFAISTLLGVLAEIPTGVFADKYGRKKAVISGSAILTIGWFLMATVTGFTQFLIGASLAAIGRAFVSGALDAVTYDELPGENKDTTYEKIVTLREQATTILFSITVLIGGFLYQYYIRLPHLLFAFSNLLAMVASLFLVETTKKRTTFENTENPLGENLIGFKELQNKRLRPFLFTGLTLLAVFFLYDWGFSKPTIALNAGFGVEKQAIIFSFLAVVNVLAIRTLPMLRKKFSDFKGILILCMLMGVGFIVGSFSLGYVGLIALVVIELAGYVSYPWISLALNKHISAQHRATTLSTFEFVSKIPYIFSNILLGSLLDSGHANIFHLAIGLVMIVIALVVSVTFTKKPAI